MVHLHFTQSLEPLHGAGLGDSTLGLHQGLLQIERKSHLVTTRQSSFKAGWPNVEQYVRAGPGKAFYAPAMRSAADEIVRQSSIIHGHGFYVYTNWLFGDLARKHQKPLIYHIHGFLDPWILARSKLKKRIAHWLFEDTNFKNVRWWRAVTTKEADQARAFGIRAPIEVFPNGAHLPAELAPGRLLQWRTMYPRTRNKRLLFLSRIHPKKGLDLLLKAWSHIDRNISSDWEIAIFGPDEWKPASHSFIDD